MIALLAYQTSYRYLKPFMNIGVSNVENRTHTRPHTHTSGRQLKIFLDVLDYSKYSDTSISKKMFFHESIASSVRKLCTGYVRKQNTVILPDKNFTVFMHL